MKIILATWNISKYKWLSDGFSKTNLPIAPIIKDKVEDVEEIGSNCAENAQIKVHSIGPAENSIIIGEDSGLFIDALDGFPGVKTVRWMPGTDDDRSNEILKKMKSVPINNRAAKFISTIALLLPNGSIKIFTGILKGYISQKLLGEPGRGYGRIFILPNGKSIADSGSSIIQKNDHRFQAIEKAINYISTIS